jgi:hypothetical protein
MSHRRDRTMPNAATIANEMQTIVRRAAEPWAPGDSIKAALDRAARRTGIGFRRVRTLWYRQTEAISAVEADTLREWHRNWIATQRERLTAELQRLETEWAGGNE